MASSTAAAVEKDLYEQVIDALNSIFGSHPSTGRFMPRDETAEDFH